MDNREADRQGGAADVERRIERAEPTEDVGSEGGSPGDVEMAEDRLPLTGSESGEIARPARPRVESIVRDEKGQGRRSP